MAKRKKPAVPEAPEAAPVETPEAPAPLEGRSAERAAENDAESKALAKELEKGFYWRVSLPSQPVVSVECEKEEAAIELYNRWAGINGSDHPYTTEKVPQKGPRVYETDDKQILYGASGKPGAASWSPPSTAPNQPKSAESTN